MRAVQVVGYHQHLEMAEVPVPEPTHPFDVVRVGGAADRRVAEPNVEVAHGSVDASGVTR